MAKRAKAGGELVLMPLGGMGEIGMNAYAYGLGAEGRRKWILVDLGVKFGDEFDPGIDVIPACAVPFTAQRLLQSC